MTDTSVFKVGDPTFFKYKQGSALWSSVIKELDIKHNTAVIELDGILIAPPNQTNQDPFTGNLLITRRYLVSIDDLIYRKEEPGDDFIRVAFQTKLQAMKTKVNPT
jgi:hypothetical protein